MNFTALTRITLLGLFALATPVFADSAEDAEQAELRKQEAFNNQVPGPVPVVFQWDWVDLTAPSCSPAPSCSRRELRRRARAG